VAAFPTANAQIRAVSECTTALAAGVAPQPVTVPARGEMLELKQSVNALIHQLNAFVAMVPCDLWTWKRAEADDSVGSCASHRNRCARTTPFDAHS
jgi:HAMP domain-containing protein